jgi:hypothetical protein
MATFRSSQEINRQLPTQYAQRKKATGMQVFANWATGLDRFGRKKDTNILGDVARGVVNMATLGGLQMATRKYYRGSAGGVGAIQAANQAQGKAYVDLALTAATLGTGTLASKIGAEATKQAGKQLAKEGVKKTGEIVAKEYFGKLGQEFAVEGVKQTSKQGIKSAIGTAVQQGKNLATSYLSADGTKNLSKDFVQNLISKGGDTKFIEFAKQWALENKDELIKKGVDKGLEKAKEVYKEQFGNEPTMQPRGAQEVFKSFTDYEGYLNEMKEGGTVPDNGKYTTKLTDKEEKEFQDWYSKVSKHKNLNPNPDAEEQKYDYRGYWKNEDREGILSEDTEAHFIDKYKQPFHPTFSTESQYSNEETLGGSWSQDESGTWFFTHSPFTAGYADKTFDYLKGSGEFSILNGDTLTYDKPPVMNREKSNFKTGGKIPNHYPSHKEGGVMAIDKKTGKPVAEVEGGEEVFSVKDTKKMESFMKKGDTKGLGKFVQGVMKKHRKNPSYSYASSGTPELGKYSDFKEKIAKVESKGAGGYKAQNPESSAVGKYQFIWDGNKNWRGWKSDIMKVTGVKSKEEFLNSEKAQEQFMDYYIENTLKKDADSLRKTNPEETKGMSDEQLMALAHFQGRSNAKTFLETGKTANKENNLSVEEYLNKAGFTNEGGQSDTNEGGQSDKKEDVSFLTTLNQSIKEAGKGFAEPINEKRKQVVEREESIKELEKKWKNSEGLDDETKDRIYNDLQNERLSKLLLQKEILDLKKERNDKINEVFDLEENKSKLFEEYDKGNITEEDYKKIRSELNQFSERNALFNQKYQELTDRYEAQKQARFPYDNAADYEAQNRLKEGTTKYLTAEEAARKDSAMAEEQGLPAFTEEEIQERIQEYKEEYGEQGVPAAGEAVGTRLPTGEEIEGGLAQMGDYTQRTELGVEGEASEYTKEKSRFVEGTKDDPFKKVKREMAVQGRTPEELEGEMQYLEQEFSSVNNVQDYDYLSTVLDEYALADEASFELDKEGKGDGTGQEEEYVPVDSESTLEDDYNLGNGNFDKETFDNYVRTKKEERQALGLENVYNKLGGLDAVLQATGMAAAYKFATAPMPQQRKSDAWQEQMARMKDRTQLGLDPATKTLYQRNAERTYAYDVSNIGRVASSANAALGSLGSASERKYQADMMMAAQDASLREAHQAQYMNAMEKDEAMTQEHWLRNVYNEADRKRELKAGLTGQFVSNLRDNLKYYEEYIDPSSMRNQYMQSIISETQAKEQSHLSSQYAQLRQTGMSEENAIARVYGEQQSQPESKVETGVFGGLINNIFNKK